MILDNAALTSQKEDIEKRFTYLEELYSAANSYIQLLEEKIIDEQNQYEKNLEIISSHLGLLSEKVEFPSRAFSPIKVADSQ
jgi:hypothetical protein